ncbi:hypothetical protein BU24DRAFT_270151 [Aaosphaeria arxii CBS 175.79]|uniref:Uncharacterized protein n=1 Tax=Aaosphaeria arxii CBS 175.79 TaxID=1450172 RepID=A0A6A5XGX6_9PLEO|nr:uncharacterized protein BU24DRAFT_270151 [Aaosphaeria arxii CBS 175.79]KAF2012119.1 hypothetical protein BU24DRAFT_270151 [Aaosphaeria arxii CBS 175.79]
MAGPPPPGHQWLVDVSQNPNINHDPLPPPAFEEALQAPPGAPVGVIVNGPAPGAAVLLGNPAAAPPPPAPAPPGMALPIGPPPPYASIPIPGHPPLHPNGGPALYTQHPSHPPFPPPPIPGSGISPLNWGSGYGGFPAPFAGSGLPWTPGAAPPVLGGVGVGGMYPGGMAGMGMGMGMPYGMGGMGMGLPFPFKPPPPIIDGGSGAVPGAQNDATVKPEGDLPGHTVCQPAETTAVYRIHCNWPPWETSGVPLTVEPMQVDSGWTVNRLIGAMRLPDADCQGWAVTECIELGNGRWAKGVQFHHGQQQATEQTLGMVGWGKERNRNGESPLYLFCHRI